MDTYPILQVIGGLIFLIVSVLWIRWFIRRADPWLRERIGRWFGVTLKISGRGMWTVTPKDRDVVRGILIEMLQPLFWIPAVMLPLIIFVVLLMFFGQT
jgi:hypothetical protein